jgi:predicted RNA-binding Zn-ribbon protein involved in translation (DUF1610 family)
MSGLQADLNAAMRYCVVCERELGPSLKSHCTDASLVATAWAGVFRKKRLFFSLADGLPLTDDEVAQKALVEKGKLRVRTSPTAPPASRATSAAANVPTVIPGVLPAGQEPPFDAVRLWTASVYTADRRRRTKRSILRAAGVLVALGTAWGLTKLSALMGVPWLKDMGVAIGVLFVTIPVLVAMRRAGSTFEDVRDRAMGEQSWWRKFSCPSCGQSMRVNVGYYEYRCADCRREMSCVAPFVPIDWMALEQKGKEGYGCTACTARNALVGRTARFLCSGCGTTISLDAIPYPPQE